MMKDKRLKTKPVEDMEGHDHWLFVAVAEISVPAASILSGSARGRGETPHRLKPFSSLACINATDGFIIGSSLPASLSAIKNGEQLITPLYSRIANDFIYRTFIP